MTATKTKTHEHPLDTLETIAPDDWRGWVEFGLACAAFDWSAERACADRRHRRGWRRHRAARRTTARAPASRTIPLTMQSIREDEPGEKWQALFEATWPAYRAWYAKEGLSARPSLAECREALTTHMPELLDTWERLVTLAGDDEEAARMLSLWNPPAYEAGCTQAVLGDREPVLVRNYDYDPELFEGVVASTNLSGRRRVLGTSDCLWGLLDGMNEDGLVVSLTLGGRPAESADGFGIPLVMRYLLETCGSVAEARTTLQRLPVAQAYNLTLADTSGVHVNAFVAPGEPASFADLAVATNHRHRTVEHASIAGRLNSVKRQDFVLALLDEAPDAAALTEAFLRPPVYTDAYSRGFGTLYTACYEPARGRVTYRWPERMWVREFDSTDAAITAQLREPTAGRQG